MKIKYVVQTSDHDGYCSGNECEYAEAEGEIVAEVPAEVFDDEHGYQRCHGPNECRQELAPYIADKVTPALGDGSGYCDVSIESIKHGLGSHEARVVVLGWKPARKSARKDKARSPKAGARR